MTIVTLVTFLLKAKWNFCEDKAQTAHMPAYVPILFCSTSYLLSSEQLAGNILPTSRAKHFSLGGGHRALVLQHANLAQFGDTQSAPV